MGPLLSKVVSTSEQIGRPALRFAGDMAPYLAGGILGSAIMRGVQNNRTEQANLEKFEQLRQMGLSQKDLQQVALAMNLPPTVLEPTEYV